MGLPVLTERQHFPVIANLVVGVRTAQNFIADKIAPGIDTNGAPEYEYDLTDNSAMVAPKPEEASRGLRGETTSILQPEEATKKGTVKEWARKAEIDINEIEADRARDRAYPVPVGRMTNEERRYKRLAAKLYFNLKVLKEQSAASKVFALLKYDVTLRDPNPANFKGDASIIKLMLSKIRAVSRKWGVKPDTLLLGWDTLLNLFDNAAILDRVTGGASVANPADIDLALLAKLFRIPQVVCGEAVIQTLALPGAAGVPTDIWKPNGCALIHTGITGIDEDGDAEFDDADESTPAFVKRFFKNVPEELGGGPLTLQAYNSLNNKIRYLEATEYWKHEQTSQAGFYWDNTNAA